MQQTNRAKQNLSKGRQINAVLASEPSLRTLSEAELMKVLGGQTDPGRRL
jgi:hypothetical protein